MKFLSLEGRDQPPVLNLSKDEGEISPYEAKAPDVIASFLWVERTTTKEPTVPDIAWHGRLFAIAGVISYAGTGVSHT
jgi:hypothetical protein